MAEGIPNLNNRLRDHDHAHLGTIHHALDTTRRGLSNKEKTKCLASPVQKLRGSQNLKSRSRDPDRDLDLDL